MTIHEGIETDGDFWELLGALGGGWIVTRNGWQSGGPFDARLGCGTAVYETREEAHAARAEGIERDRREAARFPEWNGATGYTPSWCKRLDE